MNILNNFDKTDREYLLASSDDLIQFWSSDVKTEFFHNRLSICWNR